MTHCFRCFVVAFTALVLTVASLSLSRGQQTPKPPVAPLQRTEKPTAVPADARAELTETVGLLSGLYLYQTYLNIGLLADGKAEKVYDEKAARAVLATVLTPLEAVDKQLAKVKALAQTEADRQAAEKLRAALGLLRRQGQELIAFWDSGKAADGAKYEATRQEVWKQINALLGLDKK